jgi:hypothetical protein
MESISGPLDLLMKSSTTPSRGNVHLGWRGSYDGRHMEGGSWVEVSLPRRTSSARQAAGPGREVGTQGRQGLQEFAGEAKDAMTVEES